MKELDLMYALDAVEDDLLLEADTFAPASRKISWVRIVAVAAVVALLAFSVYAAYAEARISYPDEDSSWLYQSFEVDGIKYSHVQIEYDLQPVEIREHATGFLTDMVDSVSHWYVEDGELIGGGYILNHSFESLEMAENFFGLTFDLPAIVREGTVFDREVLLKAVPMYFPAELPAEAAFDYEPDLGGAEVYFSVEANDERIGSVSVMIYLGLTEEFTAVPATTGMMCALEELGEPQIQEIRIGDEEYTVLTYSDNPENSVAVYYVRNGIGYGLTFYPTEEYNGDPLRLIHSHLKDIG